MKRAAAIKAIRPVVKEACAPLVQAVKAEAPTYSGATKRAVDVRVRTYKRAVVGVVGVRSGRTEVQTFKSGRVRKARPSYYGWIVERGNKRSKANPFTARGFERAKGAAQSILQERITENILKAVKETT
jgi:hypothetical protein